MKRCRTLCLEKLLLVLMRKHSLDKVLEEYCRRKRVWKAPPPKVASRHLGTCTVSEWALEDNGNKDSNNNSNTKEKKQQ